MRFDLVRPCGDCPFRSDRRFELRRGPELAREIFEEDQTFLCHNTAHGPRRRRQHCGGALVLHEKLGRPNWRLRLAHRLGLYDPARLDLGAPVVDTVAEFLTQTREQR